MTSWHIDHPPSLLLPLPEIHTYAQLRSFFRSLLQHQRHNDADGWDFAFVNRRIITDIEHIETQIDELRQALTDRSFHNQSEDKEEAQFYIDALDKLTDLEDCGVDGWKRWIEAEMEMEAYLVEEREMQEADPYHASTGGAVTPTSTRCTDDTDSDSDEDGLLHAGRSNTPSPPARNLRRGRIYVDPSPRSRSASTNVETGSLLEHQAPLPVSAFSSTTASSQDSTEEQTEAAHLQERVDWIEEENERRRRFDAASPHGYSENSPPRVSETNPPYIHIPLPPGFTIPALDSHSLPITFDTSASVFHFPAGATREQLLILLHQRQKAGYTQPNFAPGEDVNVLRVRTLGMEWELKNAILRELTRNFGDGEGWDCESSGGQWLWERGSGGDTYIVSRATERDIRFHGLSHEGSPRRSATYRDDDVDEIEKLRPSLRGGDGAHHNVTTSNYARKYGRLGAHNLDNYLALSWMEEAHVLQLKYSNLQDMYTRLQSQHEGLQKAFETNQRRLVGACRAGEFWMLEADAARARAERLNRELAEVQNEYREYYLETQKHECTVEGVQQGLEKLREEDDTVKFPQQDPYKPSMRGGGDAQTETPRQRPELNRAPSLEWKEWKGLPTPGLLSAGSSHASSNHRSSSITATGFYFFPSVSTIALLSEPMHFLQWSAPITLSQIRNFLRLRDRSGIEDNDAFVRVRKILEKRDELGMQDPDVTSGRMVLISVPADADNQPGTLPADKQTLDEVETSAWERTESNESAAKTTKIRMKNRDLEHQGDLLLQDINVLRRECGLSDLDLQLDTYRDSDSENEVQYTDISYLANVLTGQVDSEGKFEPDHDSESDCECRECYLDQSLHNYCLSGDNKDSAVENTSEPHSDRRPDDIRGGSPHLSQKSYDADESDMDFSHAKGQGCESWIGHLDQNRDRCTYCDLPYVELEPYGAKASTNSSLASSITAEDAPPNPSVSGVTTGQKSCSYGAKPGTPFYRGGGAGVDESIDEECMTASYPFKVCTNPYATPPFTDKSSTLDSEASETGSPCEPNHSEHEEDDELFRFGAYVVPVATASDMDEMPSPPAIELHLTPTSSRARTPASSVHHDHLGRAAPSEQGKPRDFYRRQAEEEDPKEAVEVRASRLQALVGATIRLAGQDPTATNQVLEEVEILVTQVMALVYELELEEKVREERLREYQRKAQEEMEEAFELLEYCTISRPESAFRAPPSSPILAGDSTEANHWAALGMDKLSSFDQETDHTTDHRDELRKYQLQREQLEETIQLEQDLRFEQLEVMEAKIENFRDIVQSFRDLGSSLVMWEERLSQEKRAAERLRHEKKKDAGDEQSSSLGKGTTEDHTVENISDSQWPRSQQPHSPASRISSPQTPTKDEQNGPTQTSNPGKPTAAPKPQRSQRSKKIRYTPYPPAEAGPSKPPVYKVRHIERHDDEDDYESLGWRRCAEEKLKGNKEEGRGRRVGVWMN
jgi:hypothetical protein